MNPVLKAKEEFKVKLLDLYKSLDTFSDEDNLLINDCIDAGDIETEDIRVDFKEWVYAQCLPIDDEDIWAFDEHYSNGLTHKENLKILTDNLED